MLFDRNDTAKSRVFQSNFKLNTPLSICMTTKFRVSYMPFVYYVANVFPLRAREIINFKKHSRHFRDSVYSFAGPCSSKVINYSL